MILNLWWQGFLTAVGLYFLYSLGVAIGRLAERNGWYKR